MVIINPSAVAENDRYNADSPSDEIFYEIVDRKRGLDRRVLETQEQRQIHERPAGETALSHQEYFVRNEKLEH